MSLAVAARRHATRSIEIYFTLQRDTYREINLNKFLLAQSFPNEYYISVQYFRDLEYYIFKVKKHTRSNPIIFLNKRLISFPKYYVSVQDFRDFEYYIFKVNEHTRSNISSYFSQ